MDQVEQMKKKSKKAGAAKKEKKEEEAPAEAAAEAKLEATTSAIADEPAPDTTAEEATEEPSSPTQSTASLSKQSKLRSSSFRQGPLSPGLDGETAADIYRKQVARIEDLEKENKRLAKEASDAEKRYKQAEEDLADLQEADRDGSEDSQVEKLVRAIYILGFNGWFTNRLCSEIRDCCASETERTIAVSCYETSCVFTFNSHEHAARRVTGPTGIEVINHRNNGARDIPPPRSGREASDSRRIRQGADCSSGGKAGAVGTGCDESPARTNRP
jgi:hypothetical protein